MEWRYFLPLISHNSADYSLEAERMYNPILVIRMGMKVDLRMNGWCKRADSMTKDFCRVNDDRVKVRLSYDRVSLDDSWVLSAKMLKGGSGIALLFNLNLTQLTWL